MNDRRHAIRIPFPLDVAVVLVELAEDIGDLEPGERQAVHDARDQIDRIVERHRRFHPECSGESHE